jgi:hypothetical protein
MQKKRSMLTKLVGAALIFLTLASTAVVVAKSCHDEPIAVAAVTTVAHTSHGDHVHTPPANSATNSTAAQGVLNSGLISDICTGIFYLVLILGSRFLLKNRFATFKVNVAALNSVVAIYRSKVEKNLTLSLPQLGISRI